MDYSGREERVSSDPLLSNNLKNELILEFEHCEAQTTVTCVSKERRISSHFTL